MSEILIGNSNLTWALCIATLNRIDMLEKCITCALSQTRPPREIVIVDASEDWQANRTRIAHLIGGRVPLQYLPAPERSSTVQRNTAIKACSSDICMLIDDDSLMHPDCAEIIMQAYEIDVDGELLGIAGVEGPSPMDVLSVARKVGSANHGRLASFRQTRLMQFLWRELFLMSRAVNFVPYAGPAGSRLPSWTAERGLDLAPTLQLPGCRMTARRSVLLQEPFEPAFRSYSPGEDFDISYRLSRIGTICVARNAKIYHHEIAASRIKREQETVLSICNAAFLLRKHSPNLGRDRRLWSLLMSRRLLAEALKDGLSRRWKLPQMRAAWRAAAISRGILKHADDDTLAGCYISIQQGILTKPTPSH
ncbi:glycosyltransferase family A protein [Paracoccus sp. AK26]|uniref:glycosyltransferase family A protein n=1 Tax=Paracoccus sp. AK26 TaxID=2589076 RepID=UPI0014281E87|nr:glycosyltransferase family A protein [Paracoccus sp. AK26]QIR84997.1 glycosyltransferase family 2 protein [Paracoccus sp. AK26]